MYLWCISKSPSNRPPSVKACKKDRDSNNNPPTPSTIFVNWSPPSPIEQSKIYSESPIESICFNSVPPEFEIQSLSQQISSSTQKSIGIETDPFRSWVPPPRDPLSDFANLPPITLPEIVTLANQVDLFDSEAWSLKS